jgi:hypothetical protein
MPERDTGACTFAIRLATGDTFSDDEIDKLMTRPLQNRINDILAQEAISRVDATKKAAAQLAKQQIMQAMYAASAKHYTEKSRTFRRDEMTARMDGGATPVDAARSYAYGTKGRFKGSGVSAASWGQEVADSVLIPFEAALKQRPGLMQRMSSDILMKGEPGFSRKVDLLTAQLMGDTSVVVPNEDIDDDALHAARAGKALLEEIHKVQSDEGAIIPKLEGYTGRRTWDPMLVGGTLWGDYAKAIADGHTKDEAAHIAEKKNFLNFDKAIRADLLPKSYEGLGLADVAHGYEIAKDIGGTGVEPPEELGEDEEALHARGQAFMDGLYARGLIKSRSDFVGAFLYRIWARISLGRREGLEGNLDEFDFVPGGSRARALGQARVLHFAADKNADIRAQFSRDNLYGAWVKAAIRAGRNAAALKFYGPTPEWGYREQMKFLQDESESRGLTLKDQKLIGSGATRVPFEAVTGVRDSPVNVRTARIFSDLRQWMQMTKLSSIPLSKPADFAYMSSSMIQNGMSVLENANYVTKGIAALADPERRAAARAMGAGTRNFSGRLLSTWMKQGDDARPGRMAVWAQQAFRASGFLALNEGMEIMAVSQLQELHGDYADTPIDQLPKDMQNTFSRFKVSGEHWDLARQGLTAMAEDGDRYLTLDHLDDDASPLAHETRALFRMLYHEHMTQSINEPGVYERAAARAPLHEFGLTQSMSQPGTVQGEMLDSFFQFKGFVTRAVRGHFAPAIQQARDGNWMPLIHLLVTTSIAGYVGLQLKRLSRGELPQTPQDLIEAAQNQGQEMSYGEAAGKLWLGSLAQGGALGMYGDFLFGNMDRNGADFDLTSLGGPMLSSAGQVAKIVIQAINGGQVNGMDGRSMIPGELAQLTAQNIPIVNTWYTRLAIDYLWNWRLQELLSPGYLQRRQDRMQEKAATHYWLAPTTPSPYSAVGIQ